MVTLKHSNGFKKTHLLVVHHMQLIASGNGHLEIVKFIHENIKQFGSQWALDLASINGHIDVVTFLNENQLVEQPHLL